MRPLLVILLTSVLLQGKLCFAQNKAKDELSKLIQTLRQELSRAGVDAVEVSANGAIGKAGFQLDLLTSSQSVPARLNSEPHDGFYIKATDNSVYIASRSIDGLQNGVFWYLNYLGFRYYFPNDAWHIIPQLSTVFKNVEKVVMPSFLHRRIWYAYGSNSKKADNDYTLWSKANLQGGEGVNAGHSYDGIVSRNKPLFFEHPEYFAGSVEKGKIPPNPKFEVSNEGLVQLCIADAFSRIESELKKSGRLPNMISMDPSDGGGFSKSPASLKIGGASEQAFYLANRVASAIRKKYPSVKVGMYAYNLHAIPPAFDLEPNIVVLVATAMTKSEYRTDELINMWQKKGATVGLRDYLGVIAWDWDMPGQVAGGKLSYVKNLKYFYQKGIRYYSAETNIGWISRGLGHFIAAQLLWDVNADVEKLRKEFFTNSFGKAANQISELYAIWETYGQNIPLEGDLLKWNNLVTEAATKEKDISVQRRIAQIREYLYYVYLFQRWKKSNQKQELTNLLSFANKVKDKGVMASYPLIRRLGTPGIASAIDKKAGKQSNGLDSSRIAVELAEIEKRVSEVNHNLNALEVTETPVFPTIEELVGVEKKDLYPISNSNQVQLRGTHTVIFSISEPQGATLNISVGLIKSGDYKPLKVQVYTYNEKLSTPKENRIIDQYLPAGQKSNLSLSKLKPGSYIALLDDSKSGFTLSLSGTTPFAIIASNTKPIWTLGRNTLYFYVPPTTRSFNIQNYGVMTIVSPSGRKIDLQKNAKGFITVDVKKAEEGIWKIQMQNGKFYIQGLIPFVAPDAKYLLIH